MILTKFKNLAQFLKPLKRRNEKEKTEYLVIGRVLIEQKFKKYLFFCIFAVRFLLKNNK
jgi:hypothetical protein